MSFTIGIFSSLECSDSISISARVQLRWWIILRSSSTINSNGVPLQLLGLECNKFNSLRIRVSAWFELRNLNCYASQQIGEVIAYFIPPWSCVVDWFILIGARIHFWAEHLVGASAILGDVVYDSCRIVDNGDIVIFSAATTTKKELRSNRW